MIPRSTTALARASCALLLTLVAGCGLPTIRYRDGSLDAPPRDVVRADATDAADASDGGGLDASDTGIDATIETGVDARADVTGGGSTDVRTDAGGSCPVTETYGVPLAISLGVSHTCVVPSGGAVLCFGSNTFGKLGNGTVGGATSMPTRVQGLPCVSTGERVAELASAANTTCALTSRGRVFCWGSNVQGELGIGSSLSQMATARLVTFDTAVAVRHLSSHAAGHTFCAQFDGALIECWGGNDRGQVLLSAGSIVTTPVRSFEGASRNVSVIDSLSVGNRHVCLHALANGQPTAFCWGANDHYQQGNTNTAQNFAPHTPAAVPVLGLTGPLFVGGDHVCEFRSTATSQLYCWGAGTDGQLGTAARSDEVTSSTMVERTDGSTDWKRGWGGDRYTCAIASNDTLWCWGNNFMGQSGVGRTDSPAPPLQVALASVTSVALGVWHSCAITSPTSGAGLYCWGANESGQLGQPMSVTPQRAPSTPVVLPR